MRQVQDYRVINRCTYNLESILFIALCTVLSRGEDYCDMEEFGIQRKEWLKQYINLPDDKTPSHDTFERVFENLDIEEFRRALLSITKTEKLDLGEELIAIDGKKIRGASPQSRGNNGLYILTAWACNEEVCLGQVRVDDKSNEITAIPKLLEKVDVSGQTVSIDAMGCQTDIVETIIEKQGHYLLAVKKNQSSLLEEMENVFAYASIKDRYKDWDYGHGRYEERVCEVLEARDYLSPKQLDNWKNIQTLIKITGIRVIDDVKTIQSRFYISDEQRTAEDFNGLVRTHWSIENKLHWNLDVVLGEDISRVSKGNGPENLNTLNKLSLRFLTQKKDKLTKPKKRFKAALNIEYLEEILNVNF